MNESCKYCGLCCEIYSSNPAVNVPEECCRSGEIFLKRETLKQKIRKFKEEIIHYEALITADKKNAKSYEKIIRNHNRFIDRYSMYGAQNW